MEQLESVEHDDGEGERDRKAQLAVQIGAIKTRVTRLVDALLDGVLDKHSFEDRKRTLLEEQQSLEDSLRTGGLTKA